MPHDTTTAAGLAAFTDAIRGVLRTRYNSPGGAPEALENWDRVDGRVWRWSTDGGLWRVAAGAAADPRPLVHGPDGYWRVDAQPGEHAAGLVLVLLRAGGAIPPAAPVDQAARYMPCCFAGLEEAQARGRDLVCGACGTPFLPPIVAEQIPTQAELLAAVRPSPAVAALLAATPYEVEDHRLDEQHPRQVTLRPRTAVVRGKPFTPAATAEPLRAVLYRPSDPVPEVPAGHLAVPAVADQPDDQGGWEVTMPDGWRRIYDPARSVLMPYETEGGATALLLFEADQLPGHVYPARGYAPTPDLQSRGAA